MKPEIAGVLAVFAIFALAELAWTGLARKPGQQRKDAVVETVSTLWLLLLTQPAILLASGALMSWLFPLSAGSLAQWPVLAQIGLLLVFDDMAQYWWHRLAHTTPWLYNLHRAHHDAPYMSIRIVYRNNIFYYMMMPGIWFSGALIYLGLGAVYAFYIVVKLAVICGAHSDVRWDRRLYELRWLSPLMWVVERVISTPATHSAHHGKHKDDGVTHYKGNYGNLLFVWDILFGTAKITRRYPAETGVENLEPVSAAHQLLWPVVRDR
jgi:sterol desaturase/sphingolipid hydroxylase (fatty acid hydroxylase superfamily)